MEEFLQLYREVLEELRALLKGARHYAPLREQLLGSAKYSVPRRTHPPRHVRGPENEYKF